MIPLTDRQKLVYHAIKNHTRHHGWPPTYKEISASVDIDTASAWGHVQRIAKKGYIRVGGGPREICLLRYISGRKIRD